MTPERIAALEKELLDYTEAVFERKHYEVTCIEIRIKLDELNREIDRLTEEGNNEDLNIISFISYQYYRLLYS